MFQHLDINSTDSSSIYLQETPWKHEEKFSGASHCEDAFADKGEIGKLIRRVWFKGKANFFLLFFCMAAQIVERDENNSVIEEDLTLVINEGRL